MRTGDTARITGMMKVYESQSALARQLDMSRNELRFHHATGDRPHSRAGRRA
jgi:hypothetical protein